MSLMPRSRAKGTNCSPMSCASISIRAVTSVRAFSMLELAAMALLSPAVFLAPIIEIRWRVANSAIVAGMPEVQDGDHRACHLVTQLILTDNHTPDLSGSVPIDWSADSRPRNQPIR